jgi:hypothetical protein
MHSDISLELREDTMREDAAFNIFTQDIPERAAIANALGNSSAGITYSNKWGAPVIDIVSSLTNELREAFRDDQHRWIRDF